MKDQLAEMASAIVSMRGEGQEDMVFGELDEATWTQCEEVAKQIKTETGVEVSPGEIARLSIRQGLQAIKENPQDLAWIVAELRKLELDKPSACN